MPDASLGSHSHVEAAFQQPPLPLTLDGAFWLVEAGEADIFAVNPGDPALGVPPGPRLFIGRAAAGTVLVGGAPGDEILLAVPAAGARVVGINDWTGPDGLPGLVRAMDDWAALLTGFIAQRFWRPAEIGHLARPGTRVVLAPGEAVAARQGCAWARCPDSGMRLLGLEPLAGLVPLPHAAWLVAGSAAEITILPGLAPEPGEIVPGIAGLVAFTAAVIAMLPAMRGLVEADESGRLAQRSRIDAHDARHTVDLAAGLVGRHVAPAPLGADEVDDPLFHVMSAVARAAGLHGRLQRPAQLREQDLDRSYTMEEVARASGLRLRRVALPPNWWRRDIGPLVGHDSAGAPLALLPRAGGYDIIEPGNAPARLSAARAEALDSHAWVLLRQLPDAPQTPASIARIGRVQLLDRWLSVAAALLGASLGLGLSFGTSFAMGVLIPAGDLPGLAMLGIALVVVGIADFSVKMLGDIARHRMQASLEAPLHAALWDRVLRLPQAVLRRFGAADLAARLNTALSIPMATSATRTANINSGAMLAAAMLAMLVYHPVAALAGAAILMVQIIIPVLSGKMRARAHGQGISAGGMADSLAMEAVSGISKIRLAGVEQRVLSRWSERFITLRHSRMAEERIETWQAAISAALGFVGAAGLFVVFAGGLGGGGTAASNAAVAGFLMAYMLASGAAASLGHGIGGQYPLQAGAGFAAPLLQAMPEPTVGRIDPGRLSGRIDITNLAFAYEGSDTAVLFGLNLAIEPGEFVAIVGRSGCGKSTLVKLLLGLERPRQGAVTFDGQDLASLDLGLVRRRIGTVLQGAQLPPGPLLDSVRGFSNASEATVWQALRDAAIADDVLAMPLGIRTPIADATRSLSGGQVQRLLLARALVNKPDLLILDEATSALDNATQAVTTRTLTSLSCTRIVIAHRIETIRDADRIIVLDRGQVVAEGRLDALQARGLL